MRVVRNEGALDGPENTSPTFENESAQVQSVVPPQISEINPQLRISIERIQGYACNSSRVSNDEEIIANFTITLITFDDKNNHFILLQENSLHTLST